MMNTHVVCLALGFTLTVFSWASALTSVIEFNCDNSLAERAFIAQDCQSSVNPPLPSIGAFRVTDKDHFVIYRFELPGVSQASVRLKLANSYKISLGTDGRNFKTVLKTDKTYKGLVNVGECSVDLTPFLKSSDVIYLKSEDAYLQDGWGGCLFFVKILADQQPQWRPQILGLPMRGKWYFDGEVSDEVWKQGQMASNFSVYKQYTFAKADTSFSVRYDETNLYLVFFCFGTNPDLAKFCLKERDGELYRDNSLEVFLAPSFDSSEYYHFAVNMIGTQFDEFCSGKTNIDWNGKWQAKTKVVGEYQLWVGELVIPWSDLDITPKPGLEMGINVCRTEGATTELSCWSPIINGTFHCRDRFGKLIITENMSNVISYGLERKKLVSNPSRFAAVVAGDNGKLPWISQITLFPKDCTHEPILKYFGDVNTSGDNLNLSERPLPAGPYWVWVAWSRRGKVDYVQELAMTLLKEDRLSLLASLTQPFYSNEKTLRIEYRRRNVKPAMYRWRITDTEENVVLQDKQRLDQASGSLTIPMPDLPDGRYAVTFEPEAPGTEEQPQIMPFEKGSFDWIPVCYSISDDGCWQRNSRPFVPLVMFLPHNMKSLEKVGFNTVVTGFDHPESPECVARNIATLNDAQEHRLGVWFHICNLFRQREDYDGLRFLVSRFKRHPALAGWYLADEPSGHAIAPGVLKKAAEIIRQIDPNHPVIGLSLNRSMFASYAPCFDAFLSDPYPIPRQDMSLVSNWIESSGQVVKGNQSLLVCLQAFGKPWMSRGPNKDEIWNMAYQAVVGGVKGIAWWAHGPARSSREWPEYSVLVPEMKKIMAFTAPSKIDYSFTSKGLYASVFNGPHGRVLVAVNTKHTTQTVTLSVKSSKLTMIAAGSETAASVNSDKIILSLSPLGYGVWRME